MRTTILLVGLVFASAGSAAERIVERSIEVNPDVRFSINSHRGSVDISTADIDTIELTAHIEHDSQDVVDRVDIEVSSSRSTVDVDVDYDQPAFRLNFGLIGFNDYEYPEVRFTVVLPENASLAVDSHRSDLNLEAPAGRVDVTAHRGRGRISGIRNDLKIDSHRTDFDIEILELNDVDLDFHRGDVELDLFGASDYTIAGETHRGNIRFVGRDYRVDQSSRDVYVNAREGDGRNMINIDSHRGNTVINFHD